jgi:hypothetical protein
MTGLFIDLTDYIPDEYEEVEYAIQSLGFEEEYDYIPSSLNKSSGAHAVCAGTKSKQH